MAEKISRDNKGVVKAEDMECKIPQDISMLSVLGLNPFIDKAEYAEDGWVYVEGKKVRKWFQSYDRITIWGPVLDDVAALEARHWKVLQYVRKFYNETWLPARRELEKVKQAHAKPTHRYTGNKGWWLYKVREFDTNYQSYPISFDWVDEPKEKLNLEIGQKYYHIDQQLHRYYKYALLFRTVLRRAIDLYLFKNHKPLRDGITLQLNINDRIYWYASTMGQWAVEWQKVAWPEDEVMQIDI